MLDRPYCDSIIISFNFKSEEQNPNTNINTSSILHNIHTQVNNNHLLPTPHTNNKSDHQSIKSHHFRFHTTTHSSAIYLSSTAALLAAQPPTTKQTNKTNTRLNNGLLNIHDSRATTPARQPSQSIPRQRAARSTQRRGSEARRPQDRFRG